MAATGGVAAAAFNIELPPEQSLLQTSFVCAADVTEGCGPNNAIATFSAEEDRVNVPLDEVPEVLVQAVLAAEDRDYYGHGGIDPVGITRALYNDLRGRGVQQGGSTITQQYVKNVYLTSERSITRKVKEAVLAVKLERELEKDEILERYLNTIYFGRGAYGVGAASRAYFDKDVRDLGLLEASYLAGLIRAPESADALAHPEEATRRRSTVLTAMAEEGYVTGEERDAAAATPVQQGVIEPRDRTGLGPVEGADIGTEYFVETVRQQIASEYGEDTLYGGGLRIYTTIDMDMQRAAWDAVTGTLDQPGDPSGALTAVDELGYVKAMVGGRDFDTSELNLALTGGVDLDGTHLETGGSGRGPGSAFKPFVLAEAIRQGVSLNSMFDAPAELEFPGVQGEKPARTGPSRTTAAPSRGCSTWSTPPRCRPTRPTPSSCWRSDPRTSPGSPTSSASARSSRRSRRWCWAPATWPPSTWPSPTAPSPTAACTTTRSSSPRSSRSTARAGWTSSTRPCRRASAC